MDILNYLLSNLGYHCNFTLDILKPLISGTIFAGPQEVWGNGLCNNIILYSQINSCFVSICSMILVLSAAWVLAVPKQEGHETVIQVHMNNFI